MSDQDTDPDCLFCQISAGDIPARTVYTDSDVLAFLDVNPLSPGHTLVIPRAHHATIDAAPAETLGAVFGTVGTITPAIEAAVDADASNIGINNGSASGQEIPHLHVHIVPRFRDDDGHPIHAVGGTSPDLSDTDLDDIADEITASLN